MIVAVDSIRFPLAGIGRYSVALIDRLSREYGPENLRFFSHLRFVGDPRARIVAKHGVSQSMPLGSRRSRLVRSIYRIVAPAFQALILFPSRRRLFLSPNFYLPPFLGRTIVTVHDLSPLYGTRFHPIERVRHLRKTIPRVVRRADAILTDSTVVAQEIAARYPETVHKVATVYPGCDPVFRPRTSVETRATLARLGLRYRSFALFVGTIEPRKNVEGLVAAYRLLDPETRYRFPLVIVGGRGWSDEAAVAAIRRGEGEGWLIWSGYTDEDALADLYAAARTVILPSWYEGFGLPVLEGMASGTPVVFSQASSMEEIAHDVGVAVDPANPASIRDGISRALFDEEWRATAIEAGLERAQAFSWDRFQARIAEVIEEVASGERRERNSGHDPA